jgi:hypothetical protein
VYLNILFNVNMNPRFRQDRKGRSSGGRAIAF